MLKGIGSSAEARLPHPRHDHVAGAGRRLRRHRGRGRRHRGRRPEEPGHARCSASTRPAPCSSFVILGTLLWLVARINIFSLFRYLAREFLLIVATSSSESALPRLIAKMEHIGVSRSTVGVVVPTGYSFNLDGTAIYLTMASLFIATAHGRPADRRRADLAAGLHDDRLQGRRRGHRRRTGHAGRRPRLAPPRADRRRRPHRRHRPVHVRGPRGHQLRRQRRRHPGHRHLDPQRRPRPGDSWSSPAATRSTRRPWSTTATATATRSRTANPSWPAPSADPAVSRSLTPPPTR